jgi:hypothetical protein
MKYFIVLLTLLFIQCDRLDRNIGQIESKHDIKAMESQNVPGDGKLLSPSCMVLIVGECEYVFCSMRGQTGGLSHKGNCKFCEKRGKK